MTPPRLGIGIIGAGRVGAVLGAAWRGQGHGIVGVSAVSDASRERAAALLDGVPVLDPRTIASRAEVLVLAVPDDALADLARGLSATGSVPGGQLVVHTSGRHGPDVLAPLEDAGCLVGALHPAMTFTGTEADLPRLIGCPMGVTAEPGTLPVVHALAVELGGSPVTIAPADRELYHASLAHAANHLVVLVDQAREALRLIGIEDPGGYLTPLLRAALEESLQRGAHALTGPVVRGDAGTVRAHLDAFAEADQGIRTTPGDLAPTYRALARAALARADLPEDAAARIRALLDDRPDTAPTAPEAQP